MTLENRLTQTVSTPKEHSIMKLSNEMRTLSPTAVQLSESESVSVHY